MNFSQLIEEFKCRENLFVIAGGPSLLSTEYLKIDSAKHPIIVCNDAYQLFPKAMLAHHMDYTWWQDKGENLLNTFNGQHISGAGLGNNRVVYPEQVEKLLYSQNPIFSRDTVTVFGSNCGLQALGLAHYFMPKNIILLGFDFKSNDTQTHWNSSQPLMELARIEKLWGIYLKGFASFAKQRQQLWDNFQPNIPIPNIYNANPDSALNYFEKIDSISNFL